MQIIDLFSGFGGFSVAGEWMGWETIQFCEIDKNCQNLLSSLFPNVPIHNDIKTLDCDAIKKRIKPNDNTILVGGFPCQPFSAAGKQKGTGDERHLWPYMLRAIKQLCPRWVVGENVRGLVNWSGGLVFDTVQTDLENEGYEIFPVLLPACGVNAPHRRDRIWFIAHSNNAGSRINTEERINGNGKEENNRWDEQPQSKLGENSLNGVTKNTNEDGRRSDERKEESGIGQFGDIGTGNNEWLPTNNDKVGIDVTNAPRLGMEGNRPVGEQKPPIQIRERLFGCNNPGTDWTNWPSQSPICGRNDGLSNESLRAFIREDSNGNLSEEEIDKIFSAAYSKWRNATIKGYGNAIVPQVAYQIFKTIEDYENQK